MTSSVTVASFENPARTRARLLAFDHEGGTERLPASLRRRGYEFATVRDRGDLVVVTLGPTGRGLGCSLHVRISAIGNGVEVEGHVRESDLSRRIGLVSLLVFGCFVTWDYLTRSRGSTWDTFAPPIFFVFVVVLRWCVARLVCALRTPDFSSLVEYALRTQSSAA
jgi:hypothetical protein